MSFASHNGTPVANSPPWQTLPEQANSRIVAIVAQAHHCAPLNQRICIRHNET
jgi:hypothetical protein